MQKNTRFFIVPGLGNSGPSHWQTYFERQGPAFARIEQREWDAPARARQFAEAWGSELVVIGDAGHIDAASGHGNRPKGLALLQEWA